MYNNTANYGLIPRSIGGFFDDIFQHGLKFAFDDRNEAFAPVNIQETESGYTLEVVAPGLKKEDFKIQVDRNILHISYENKESVKEQDTKWLRKEYRYHAFNRSFSLNEKINSGDIQAAYQDGVLKVTLPKKEVSQPVTQQITVA